MNRFKTILAFVLCLILAACAGCSAIPTGTVDNSASPSEQSEDTVASPVTDNSIHADEVEGEFIMITEDGSFTQDGGTYTITSAGTYSLRGALNGQIVVEADKDSEVVLELSGTTITCDTDSPIRILSADKVEISAKKGTGNVINDARSAKQSDDPLHGEGAINSKADLKLKGSGTLVVNAGYNNGIHCTKDVTIQKLKLKVTAVNNAIKGKDSVTIESGAVAVISTEGDGIKTESTDANKSGKTRGDVVFCGGSISVYAAGDGIQAAHDFIMRSGEKNSAPYVAIFTGSYSGYTSDNASTTSYKGVKVQNRIDISAGVIEISSYDDGLHANSGTLFDSGETGEGSITVSGGAISMAVYSPEGATGSGRFGPGGPGGHGGWGGQMSVTGADSIHADYIIEITGGEIYIDSAYEGLEANIIKVMGGVTVVTAADDGVNATKGIESAQIIVSGGILDVTVPPNGDTDGIDSNGTYLQTGGLVITRGPNIEMAAAIDANSSVSITGGTLIIMGYGKPSIGGKVKTVSLSLNSEGSHTVTVDGQDYTFTNTYSYSGTTCYSDVEVSGK